MVVIVLNTKPPVSVHSSPPITVNSSSTHTVNSSSSEENANYEIAPPTDIPVCTDAESQNDETENQNTNPTNTKILNPYQRKLSKKTSAIRRKVESQDPDALRNEVSTENRHGGGVLPTVMLAQTFSGVFRRYGAALSQPKVQTSWQAQYLLQLQGQVQISWQARHFRKVEYRFRGRRSTFARSGDG